MNMHIPQRCVHHYQDRRLYTKKQSKKQSQHISSGQRSPGNHDPKGQFKVCTRTPHYISICIHSLHNTPPGKVHNNTNIPRHNFHNKPNIPHLGNNGHPLTPLKILHGTSSGETHFFHTTRQFSRHHHQHTHNCNWPRMPLSQCRHCNIPIF